MKSTLGQLTVAEFKKRLSSEYERMTYQLESGVDFVIPPIFRISLEEFKKNEKEKAAKEIVKQILRHHKSFYNEQ